MGRWLRRAAEIAAQEDEPHIIELVPTEEDPKLAWRIAAFRAQIPTHGPILPLYARQSAKGPRPPDRCGSCGDLLTVGRVYVCEPCQRASWLALGMGGPVERERGKSA